MVMIHKNAGWFLHKRDSLRSVLQGIGRSCYILYTKHNNHRQVLRLGVLCLSRAFASGQLRVLVEMLDRWS
jgi:hypothetical protein